MFLLGLYHDLGKADRLFQEKLRSRPNQHVNHSYAGAKYLTVIIKNILAKNCVNQEDDKSLFNEIIAYVISAHHGMYDIYFDDGSEAAIDYRYNKFYKRRQGPTDKDYHFKEDVVAFARYLEEHLVNEGYQNLEDLIRKAWENF